MNFIEIETHGSGKQMMINLDQVQYVNLGTSDWAELFFKGTTISVRLSKEQFKEQLRRTNGCFTDDDIERMLLAEYQRGLEDGRKPQMEQTVGLSQEMKDALSGRPIFVAEKKTIRQKLDEAISNFRFLTNNRVACKIIMHPMTWHEFTKEAENEVNDSLDIDDMTYNAISIMRSTDVQTNDFLII